MCDLPRGYRFQPMSGACHTFSALPLRGDGARTRKTMGQYGVHFNLVHVDCHLAAVQQAQTPRRVGERAPQNANTKCNNGLLPLWGPGVTESASRPAWPATTPTS